MSSQKLTVSIDSFYQIYCVPKRNLTSDISRWFTPAQINQSLKPIYESLINQSPNKKEFKEVALIAFNRFFDARIALHLNLLPQLEDLVAKNISASRSFTQKLLDEKVNCIQAQDVFVDNNVDYFDQENGFFLPMDKDAHYFVLPIFVISTNEEIPISNRLLSPLKDKTIHEQVTKELSESPVCVTLRAQVNNDKMIIGIMESAELAAGFLKNAKELINKMITN